jgi:hypothetical protein
VSFSIIIVLHKQNVATILVWVAGSCPYFVLPRDDSRITSPYNEVAAPAYGGC